MLSTGFLYENRNNNLTMRSPEQLRLSPSGNTDAIVNIVRFNLLIDALAICRLPRDASMPAPSAGFWSATRTADELSIVCTESGAPAGATVDRGWRALKLEGPVDLDAVGVLAAVLPVLAIERVSVFVIATYDTDYLLVRHDAAERAVAALERAGHTVTIAPSFHEFERAGWQLASAHYADAFGALTTQAAPFLLDAVGASAQTRLLDVATGPGFIAAAAAARGARVVGLDFSTAMITEARRRHPSIEFREGDAQALPFEAGSFDAVVMNFGLLHLANPAAAMADAHRVLRQGGRYALTVWAPPDQAVGFGMVLRAVQEHGNPQVDLPEGPPFFRFSTAREFRAALEGAGFSDVQVQTLPLVWRLTSPDSVFEALSQGGVRTAAVLRAQTPGALEAIRAAVRRAVEAFTADGAYLVPMPAVLASASK
jgi:trans-aconitate methyltransferase